MVNVSRFFVGLRHPILTGYADIFKLQTSNQSIRLASRINFIPPWGYKFDAKTSIGIALKHKAELELKLKIAQALLEKFPNLLSTLGPLGIVPIKEFEIAETPTHVGIRAFDYKGQKIKFGDLFVLDCMFRGRHLRDL